MIDRLHGGDCLKQDIADFSVNVNPLGLAKGVKDIIKKNIGIILRYPDPSSERLKKKLADLHGVEPENIAIGNGSIELIHLVPRAFNIRKALIAIPTFSEYEFAVNANGGMPAFFNASEEDDFRIDCAGMAGLLPRGGAFFLCNPNNPTGFLLPGREVLRLAQLCRRRRALLVLDEAFIDFVKGWDGAIVVSEAVNTGSVVILRSLTKFFAMPGLRLGYAIGHKNAIRRITRLQYPWNVNGLAQLAGEKALADKDYMDRTRAFVAKERQRIFKRLADIKGLKVYTSAANFILCKLRGHSIRDSGELTRRLLRKGVYIRSCGNFRGLNNKFFRVAVRKTDENDRLIECIGKALR